MDDASEFPVLYKAAKSNFSAESACEQTLLGTPVPVAHSTLSGKLKPLITDGIRRETFTLGPPILDAPSCAPSHPPDLRQDARCNVDTRTPSSILNINSIRGLSGSLLDGSIGITPKPASMINTNRHPHTSADADLLQAPTETKLITSLSVDDAEPDDRGILIDQDELQLLEDAFSDLGCATVENECTVPTKAYATLTHAEVRGKGMVISDGTHQNDSATTISSLPSVMENSRVNELEADPPHHSAFSDQLVGTEDAVEVSIGCAPEALSVSLHLERKTPASLPTEGHEVPHTSSSGSFHQHASSHPISNLPEIAQSPRTSMAVQTQPALSISSRTASKHVIGEGKDSRPTQAEVCSSCDLSGRSDPGHLVKTTEVPNVSKQSIEHKDSPITNENPVDSTTLCNGPQLTASHVDLDQSTYLISCLHMSDVDGLLDMVHLASTVANKPLDNRDTNLPASRLDQITQGNLLVDKRTIARQRILRSLSQHQAKKTASALIGGLDMPIHTPIAPRTDNRTSPKPVDENTLPLPLSPSAVVDSSLNSTNENIPNISAQLRRSSNSVLKECHQNSQSLDQAHFGHSTKAASSTSREAPALSPLLSSSNCLVFCGAVCGQLQRQHVLIKHNLTTPLTITLLVSPGGEVFKLVDERGYLLTGSHTIRLPPDLAYSVNVAYAAHHPLSWDTGYLQLSVKEPRHSVWKIRLIGYSNSCQLECSCCTRLSSKMYWTTAARVSSSLNPSAVDYANISEPNPAGLHDPSVASVILTNFGARSAWVLASVEPLRLNQDATENPPDVSSVGEVLVEPFRMIIGPKQSQSVVVTLKPSVCAARVVFFYGDEVLRHQVRQNFVLPCHAPTSLGRRIRKEVKVMDLMHGFANEAPLQIVEMPSQLRHPIRPRDLHQALFEQLRLREHIVLNVYATRPNQMDDGPDRVSEKFTDSKHNLGISHDSISNLATMVVQEDAFPQSTTSSPLTELSLQPKSSSHHVTTKVDPQVQPNRANTSSEGQENCSPPFKLDPLDTLLFFKFPEEKKCVKKFRLYLADAPPKSHCTVCRIVYELKPKSDVTQFHRNSGAFVYQEKCKNVFEFIPEDGQGRSGANRQLSGILTTSGDDVGLASIYLPFEFHSTSANTVCKQKWLLSVQYQCLYFPQLSGPRTQQDHNRCKLYRSDSYTTSQCTFTLCLEGQVFDRNMELSEIPTDTAQNDLPHPLHEPGNAFGSPGTLPAVTSVPSHHKELQSRGRTLGPMVLRGLPAHFPPIESTSSESPFSIHQISLFNSMPRNTIFVQLHLPSAPFHLTRPTQTRFRILPNRWVHLQLTFRPVDTGVSVSKMKIKVVVLPTVDTTPKSGENSDLVHKSFEGSIQLRGVMA